MTQNATTTDFDATYELTPLANASPAGVAQFIDLMCISFQDDPLWTAVQPDRARRHAAKRFTLEHTRLQGFLARGYVVRDRATRRVVAHAALFPPEPETTGLPGVAPAAAEALTAAVGPDAATRLNFLIDMFGSVPRDVVGRDPVKFSGPLWGLQSVCVDPAVRGKGVGTWLVRKMLAMKEPCVPIVLFTQEEENVRWYRDALGFEVVDQRDVCFDKARENGTFTNWTMVYLPKRAEPAA
ncbi:hypothetical protein AMAG_04536 [Allomyces macrogynus ATCC 38327]|uniref:N-acetyltransferase domain-containing protein n=1 Tax=Allomyces macrogynus (strain ATCC 38327) TaxID=578462 RepID=A0A0L0S5I1_ALLM3|nr:hypothetical protein AMAG_04536 [Allomyces macrogynus ATCC 38327]|eukprot:KNE57676.1 hypothetical protein AMAG_04536 [Allomyces macrogynus ATCC 38327]